MSRIATIKGPAVGKCQACPARSFGPCSQFDPDSAQAIAGRSTLSRYRQGTEILSQGEPVSKVGIVVSGLVKIAMINEFGDEHVLQLLHDGELVGDPFAAECAFSWEAATDVELCWMTPAALAAMLRENPSVYRGYMGVLMQQMHEQHFSTASLRGRNTLQRLAYWLLAQTPMTSDDLKPLIRILLSRRDLASLLDMTVETLCRVLRQLDDRKAIRLLAPDLVQVTDIVRLRILAKDHDEDVHSALVHHLPGHSAAAAQGQPAPVHDPNWKGAALEHDPDAGPRAATLCQLRG